MLATAKRLLKPFAFLAILHRSMSMKFLESDGQGGRGMVVLPKSGSYSQVLFWFHGLGDTADGWASMMPNLALEDTKFVLPTASTRPITINGGYSMPGWTDIYGLDESSEEHREGFTESASRVENLMKAEMDKGIPSHKIILGGFSQGGALALHVALRSPHRLGGCAALSTWLPLRDDFPEALSETGRSLPVFQAHGDADNVVAFKWGENTHTKLRSMISEPAPQFLKIKGMGHSSHPEEIKALKRFLDDRFGTP